LGSAVRRTKALRLVEDATEARSAAEPARFCSHCANEAPSEPSRSRVCQACCLGVMLEADPGLAPAPGAAFLVVDRAMSICAISESAEQLLETSEVQAVHRHLTELLTLADTEAQDRGSLAFAVSAAVGGATEIKRFTLRPANQFGVRLVAHLGNCGPHPSALIVLDH
jgi:hypothetical protein